MKQETGKAGAGVGAPDGTANALETNAENVFESFEEDSNNGLLIAVDFKNRRAWRRWQMKNPQTRVVKDNRGRPHALFRCKTKPLVTDIVSYLPVDKHEIAKLDGIDDAVDLDEYLLKCNKGSRGYHRPAITNEFWPVDTPVEGKVLVMRGERGETLRLLYETQEMIA